jgi:hypothetical protein
VAGIKIELFDTYYWVLGRKMAFNNSTLLTMLWISEETSSHLGLEIRRLPVVSDN